MLLWPRFRAFSVHLHCIWQQWGAASPVESSMDPFMCISCFVFLFNCRYSSMDFKLYYCDYVWRETLYHALYRNVKPLSFLIFLLCECVDVDFYESCSTTTTSDQTWVHHFTTPMSCCVVLARPFAATINPFSACHCERYNTFPPSECINTSGKPLTGLLWRPAEGSEEGRSLQAAIQHPTKSMWWGLVVQGLLSVWHASLSAHSADGFRSPAFVWSVPDQEGRFHTVDTAHPFVHRLRNSLIDWFLWLCVPARLTLSFVVFVLLLSHSKLH